MRKFIVKNRVFKIIIIFCLLMFFIYGYFTLVNKTDFNDFLVFSINNKFKDNNESIVSKVVYSSLNKIVSFNDSIIKNEIDPVIENIVSENIIDKNETIYKTEPIIYIYNTHDTESYYLPFVSDYSIKPTVKLASYILKDHLNDFNISSYVETKTISSYLKKNNLGYLGSYEASRYYMKEASKEYNFKIYIDIHRDSLKYDKTLYKKDNKKYAKVLFVLAKKNKDYKYNLKFINYINNKLNKNYSGLSRGVLERNDVIFNQDISKNAILLELGGVDNTIEEINNTLYVIASVLNDYINEGMINE